LLGDLDKVNEEMQEVGAGHGAKPDDARHPTERQERILSRMLDASRSMSERDWEKKRRAETAKDIKSRNPAELDPSVLEGKKNAMIDLQKAIQRGLHEGL